MTHEGQLKRIRQEFAAMHEFGIVTVTKAETNHLLALATEAVNRRKNAGVSITYSSAVTPCAIQSDHLLAELGGKG